SKTVATLRNRDRGRIPSPAPRLLPSSCSLPAAPVATYQCANRRCRLAWQETKGGNPKSSNKPRAPDRLGRISRLARLCELLRVPPPSTRPRYFCEARDRSAAPSGKQVALNSAAN